MSQDEVDGDEITNFRFKFKTDITSTFENYLGKECLMNKSYHHSSIQKMKQRQKSALRTLRSRNKSLCQNRVDTSYVNKVITRHRPRRISISKLGSVMVMWKYNHGTTHASTYCVQNPRKKLRKRNQIKPSQSRRVETKSMELKSPT